MIGRIAPKASNGHEYILVALTLHQMGGSGLLLHVKAKHMAHLIENNIIYRYGVSQEIISDNGSHFKGEVRTIMELYNIEHYKSSPFWLQTSRVVEAANKNIKKNILAKMVVTYKDWAEQLPFAL